MRSWAWTVAVSRGCLISRPSSSSGTSSQDKSLFFSQEESSKWKSKWSQKTTVTCSKQLPPALHYLSATSPWHLREGFFSKQTRGHGGHAYPCYTWHVCASDEPLSRNWWKLENSSRGSLAEGRGKKYHLSHCVNSCTKTSILTIFNSVCENAHEVSPISLIMRIVRCVLSHYAIFYTEFLVEIAHTRRLGHSKPHFL